MICYATTEIGHHKTMRKIILSCIITLSLSACIYVPPVQQGNALDQKDVNELKPGMTKRQVNLVMGTPAIADPFHKDRWDYIYTVERKGKNTIHKQLSLSFENNKLTRIEGDFKPEKEDDDNELQEEQKKEALKSAKDE